jgi:hypothetical protein
MHTHSQDSAKDLVRRNLESGNKVHGFDATAFTDRLPFELQNIVLTMLVDRGWLSEFDQASINAMVRSDWAIVSREKEFRADPVMWAVGQPMGYGPSFHLAALTHYIILRYCADKVRVPHANKFAVVGDDVSIFDDKIAKEYYDTMTDLGVDINLEKSVTSNEVSEFCKKVILPSAVLSSITVQDNLKTESALVQAAEFYGKKLLNTLTKKQLLMCDSVMLPIEIGGLNWSPKDTSYSAYVNDILKTDNISGQLLKRSLENFYDFNSNGNLEFMLNTISSRYDYWNYPKAYDSTTVVVASYVTANDVIVSEWTGLPAPTSVAISACTKRTDKSTSPFRRIVDNSLMKHLASQSSDRPEMYKKTFACLLDKYGYILNGEKTPERPITLWSIIANDQTKTTSKKLGQSRRYLKGRIANYQW